MLVFSCPFVQIFNPCLHNLFCHSPIFTILSGRFKMSRSIQNRRPLYHETVDSGASSFSEESLSGEVGQKFFASTTSVPPSTPQSDCSEPPAGPVAFGAPNGPLHPEKTLPSNPRFRSFPIVPPGQTKLYPKFFIYREDGTPVPLIALDELPPWIKIGEENWSDFTWLRYMNPASLCPLPRIGMYQIYVAQVGSSGFHTLLPGHSGTVGANDERAMLPERGDCQSPRPYLNGGVSLSLGAILDQDQGVKLSKSSDNNEQTVIHHGLEPHEGSLNNQHPSQPGSPVAEVLRALHLESSDTTETSSQSANQGDSGSSTDTGTPCSNELFLSQVQLRHPNEPGVFLGVSRSEPGLMSNVPGWQQLALPRRSKSQGPV
ncbi:hypothetical protein VTO42DRAFT_3491 [Malbranchea cinnamomea]